MQVPTIRNITLWLALVPALAFAGCDSDDGGDDDLRSAEQADQASDRGDGHHAKSAATKLCAVVDCDDTQAERLTALLSAKAKRERPAEDDRDAANLALAQSFGSADFDADDLAEWRDAMHPEAGRGPLSADTILAVHTVLDSRQRGVLADLFEERGPGMVLGHRGGKGKHGKGKRGGKGEHGRGADGAEQGERGKRDPAALAAERVDGMCEPISCTDEQRAGITSVLADAKAEHGPERGPKAEVSDADRAFAAAFRADTLDAAQVSGYLDGLRARHDETLAVRDGVMVKIHALLTPAQRTTLAAAIEERGPKALMPHMGKRGGHHGKGGKGDAKGGKRRAEDNAPA